MYFINSICYDTHTHTPTQSCKSLTASANSEALSVFSVTRIASSTVQSIVFVRHRAMTMRAFSSVQGTIGTEFLAVY